MPEYTKRTMLLLASLCWLTACADETAGGQIVLFSPDTAPRNEMQTDQFVESDRSTTDVFLDAQPADVGDDDGVVFLPDVPIKVGRSEDLSIRLPVDIDGLHITIVGEPGVMYVVEHLEGPNGEILISEAPSGVTITAQHRQLSPFPGPFLSPNRSVSANMAVGAVLVPNNPGVTLEPGLWTFRIGAIGSIGRWTTTADVTIQMKRSTPPQTLGRLDVHFHFSGSNGWTAENAPTNRDFQQAVARMAGFYRGVGVELGTMTYDDIPTGFRHVDTGPAVPGQTASTLHDMFALNNYETGVGLFFVDRIGSGDRGGFIAGIAGGTPGPVAIPNTVRSGVAIATLMNPDPNEIGHIMGHETGHYLGLFHTQELVAGITDQIPDTSGGFRGADNLMFPTVTREQASLSDGQGWVLHRNPLIVEANNEE